MDEIYGVSDMSYAFRCEVCDLPDALPDWRVERDGDLATSWACNIHLGQVCLNLQRFTRSTEITVREWVNV